MKLRSGRLTLLLTLLLFLNFAFSTPRSVAQTFRGSISGMVLDSSGAVVAGVQIEAIDNATGAKHDATSSSGGEFTFSDLPSVPTT